GERLLARLQGYRDRDRFLARLDFLALVEIEDLDRRDEMFIGVLRGVDDFGGRHRAVDDEGEVAQDGLERRKRKRGLRLARFRLCRRNPVENDFRNRERAFDVERLERCEMQFAEHRQHELWPE